MIILVHRCKAGAEANSAGEVGKNETREERKKGKKEGYE
jgi:hypothetical protein